MGVQGPKRKKAAGEDFVASVDPVKEGADYRSIEDVPLDDYDAAIACIPDEPKVDLLNYLLLNGKHVLVEKPLWAENDADIMKLDAIARENGVYCMTAYNHRFEPHYVRMRDLIASGELGEIYRCRMFYGNGTARLVRESEWRDQGDGVLPDLGSHLLDTAKFWFGDLGDNFRAISASCFENKAPDHVVIGSDSSKPKIELEMTLLQWRNHFTCDILAEKGTAHIRSLCKWGPSSLTVRKRILPSGRPPEETVTLVQDDPTWDAEYQYFRAQCLEGTQTDLSNDLWLQKTLRQLGQEALKEAAKS
ncbi:Gfo/Idh/MocA family oxidoreductase [Magnetovibrio sp.]|uniref:Gfo/Idh/MocA family protein n=1 Tax=Magnetovibrio sp. TaxID=2024836 RepID=UPI002F92B86A